MTVRWVISHATTLPDEARIPKHFRNDAFSTQDHLLADIRDAAVYTSYYSSLNAAGTIGKEFRKYAKDAPKPIERPKVYPEPQKKKFKFISGKQLSALFQGKFVSK